jgi:predicted aspartyl protease
MMKTRFCKRWLFLLLYCVAAPCMAAAQKVTSPDSAPLVLPMEYANGHLVVELEERTLGKMRLMVDTGAEKTLLTASAAGKVKVDRHFTDRFYSFNGFGQGKKAKLAGHTSLELRVGDRLLATVEALVLDASNLETGVHPAVDGILGWDFFQHLCVRLDAKGKRMTVGAAEHCATNEEGFYAPPVEWLQEGLLLPVTVTLPNQHAMKLKLHVDTGSDNIVLSPRLRSELGLEKMPQAEAKHQGKGVNGSYARDMVMATAVEADGGHPKVEGTIPLVVPRPGSYSQPSRLFSGKNEAELSHDGVVGTSMLSLFEMIFDPVQKKLYERANSYVVKGGRAGNKDPGISDQGLRD